MAYDAEDDVGGELKAALIARSGQMQSDPRDIEQITVLIELAALELTPRAGATFTRDELARRVREIGGEDFAMRDDDIATAMARCSWLVDAGDGRLEVR